VQQFAGSEEPPAGIFVHTFAGDDDSGRGGKVPGADPEGSGCAGMLEVPVAVRSAGGPVQYVQRMGVGVAQRPQVGRGGEHKVDRVDRQIVGHPLGRGGDGGADVTGAVGVSGDEGEQPFGVGVAGDQAAGVAELAVQAWQVADDAVVGEQPASLAERVGVGRRQPAGGGVADVGDEGGRG
jgi:hypothetical protein